MMSAEASVLDSDGQLSKYKKLLSLARSSLEANQATLAKKDVEIAELQKLLQQAERVSAKEKARRGRGITGYSSQESAQTLDSAMTPRSLLCRVDIDEDIWVLIEFEQNNETNMTTQDLVVKTQWLSFASPQALDEYIKRHPGAPLKCPPRCLSSEDSAIIEKTAQMKVDRIVEDFRRFKVKCEINRKHKDAEHAHILLHSAALSAGSPSGASSATLEGSLDKAILAARLAAVEDGSGSTGSPSSQQSTLNELQMLKKKLQENEEMWKSAYEKLAKETEVLRARDGDVVASQWRERYSIIFKEKEDLAEKVRILSSIDTTSSSSGSNSSSISGGKNHLVPPFHDVDKKDSKKDSVRSQLDPANRSIEQLYVALKDEYKDFRRRSAALEQQRAIELDDLREALKAYTVTDKSGRHDSGGRSVANQKHQKHQRQHQQKLCEDEIPRGSTVMGSMQESKSEYIKQMVLQLLVCRDVEVQVNIENALIAIFRYNDVEKNSIEMRRKDAEAKSISSFTGIFANMYT